MPENDEGKKWAGISGQDAPVSPADTTAATTGKMPPKKTSFSLTPKPVSLEEKVIKMELCREALEDIGGKSGGTSLSPQDAATLKQLQANACNATAKVAAQIQSNQQADAQAAATPGFGSSASQSVTEDESSTATDTETTSKNNV